MELEPELVLEPALALLELEQAFLRPELALLRPELALLRPEPALLRAVLALKAEFWSFITFSSKFCSFQPNWSGSWSCTAPRHWPELVLESEQNFCWS